MFALINFFLFLDFYFLFFHSFCFTGVILIDFQVSVKSATLMLRIKIVWYIFFLLIFFY